MTGTRWQKVKLGQTVIRDHQHDERGGGPDGDEGMEELTELIDAMKRTGYYPIFRNQLEAAAARADGLANEFQSEHDRLVFAARREAERAAELLETNRELSESVSTLRAERDAVRTAAAAIAQAELRVRAERDTAREALAQFQRTAPDRLELIEQLQNENKSLCRQLEAVDKGNELIAKAFEAIP